MGIFQDIKTAVQLTKQLRTACKKGAEFQIKLVYSVPVVRLNDCVWLNTIEGLLLQEKKWQPAQDAFYSLSEDQRHALCLSPKQPGGWVERARFWQSLLRPVLPDGLYHEAMQKILRHYRYCIRLEGGCNA